MAPRGSAEALNLLALGLQAAAVPAYGAELLADADCEAADASAWAAYNSTLSKEAEPRTGSPGTKSLKITYNGTAAFGVRQNVLTKGKAYAYSFWYRGSALALTFSDGILNTGYPATPSPTAWKYCYGEFVASNTPIYWYLNGGIAGSWFELDDLSCKEISQADIPGLGVVANCAVHPLSANVYCSKANAPRSEPAGLREHPSATNLNLYSSIAPWTATAIGVAASPIASDVHPAPLPCFETVANSVHQYRRAAAFTAANLTQYTLSFCAKAIGARSIRASVELAGGTITKDFAVSQTEFTQCSFTFTTGAADAGATAISIGLLKAGATSYVGETACGIYFCQYIQVEAGGVATPGIYTYGATASSVAPVYDVTRDPILWRLGGRALEPEIELYWAYDLPAGIATAPMWTITTAAGDWLRLSWEPGAARFTLTCAAGLMTFDTTWTPTARNTYDIRLHLAKRDNGLDYAGTLTIINRTANTVTVIEGTSRVVLWPFTKPNHFYLHCDQTLANQWNCAIREPRG